MQFEWDPEKNRQNYAKHGIWFEDAAKVFDGFALTKDDDRFEYGELRRQTIGSTGFFTIIVVVHTDREGRTRIISARRATARERRDYERKRYEKTRSF